MATTDDKNKVVTELFEQAMKNFEQALKSGVRVQEESTRLWMGLANPATTPQDWQRRVKTFSDEIIPQTQKSLEEGLKLIEQNGRTSVELLKKAMAVSPAASLSEAQSRMLGFWEGSLAALRDSAVAVAQANARAAESLMGSVRKMWEPAPAGAKG